ncbi:hypothetical protein AVEN_138614-1 [Araneus ventricosus]|uniref:Secreted protein n=1 Tax=Araneus ventricosus TaxID=182803 RepID=A0A4Y2HVQ8_ARAVE|nr:hypothetical protein AVEN_138614-1 [Araneus ventricosus]
MTIVFLHFSPLLHGASCLPANLFVSLAQRLLELINDCQPVTLFTSCHNVPLCSIPVFQLTLPHQLLLQETSLIFPKETVIASLLSQQVKYISLKYLMHLDT